MHRRRQSGLWWPEARALPASRRAYHEQFFPGQPLQFGAGQWSHPGAVVGGYETLLATLTALGLTSGLHICLDVGDADSYDGSSQTWTDRSGDSTNFYRGTTSGAEASDPTFNGSAGDLDATVTYWSFDGGDSFRKTSANSTAIENLHKDNAAFTIAAWTYSPTMTADVGIFGTTTGAGSARGMYLAFPRNTGSPAGNRYQFFCGNGSSAAINIVSDQAGASINTWYFRALSYNEATPLGFLVQNDAYIQVSGANTFATAYTSPSASAASQVAEIAAVGGGSLRMSSGSRMAMFALWGGTALSKANLDAIYNATKGRFGF